MAACLQHYAAASCKRALLWQLLTRCHALKKSYCRSLPPRLPDLPPNLRAPPFHARALRRRRPADPTTVVVMGVGARGVTGCGCAPVAVATAADEGGTGAAGRAELAPPAGTCSAKAPCCKPPLRSRTSVTG